MIRRQKSMRFLSGCYAFPGGKVDPDDATPEIFGRCRGFGPADAERAFPSEDGLPALSFWVGGRASSGRRRVSLPLATRGGWRSTGRIARWRSGWQKAKSDADGT